MFGTPSAAAAGPYPHAPLPGRSQLMQATRSSPIDLTGDDDEDDLVEPAHMTSGSSFRPVALSQPGLHTPSPSAFYPQAPPHPMAAATTASAAAAGPSPSSSSFGRQASFQQMQLPAMVRTVQQQQPHPSYPTPPALPRTFSASGRAGIHSSVPPTVIDLTSAPTPPPPPPMQVPAQMPAHGNLPPDLPLKTPVCIGQLQVTALVLYPISYLSPSDHGGPDAEWATVRTQYAHDPKKPPASQETIHIKSPNWRNHLGENIAGENFGVVEQKVATALGPMLGKGLIRVEARVRRGRPNVGVVIIDLHARQLTVFYSCPYSPSSSSSTRPRATSRSLATSFASRVSCSTTPSSPSTFNE
jgi:SWI/SNF-related matrix-associated actin-dependent regulator of chromatin subfamily A3